MVVRGGSTAEFWVAALTHTTYDNGNMLLLLLVVMLCWHTDNVTESVLANEHSVIDLS